MWRRSISFATFTISSSDGVIRPETPTMSHPSLERGVQEPVGGDHDAEVDHRIVVAGQDDSHDALADVVDVALHGGEHDLPLGRGGVAQGQLLLLHERLEVGDGALHGAGALHDLRQEHLAGAEQVADDLHAVHQRTLDHLERAFVLLPRLLGVLLDEVDDAVHERVRQPFLDRTFAPRQVQLADDAASLDGLGERHHALGRVRAPVEDDVLDVFQQVLRDVVVHGQLAGVHDGHVQARGARVVQERRMDRLAHRLVAAEREGQVGDAARHLHAGTATFDLARPFDERLGEVAVLLHARSRSPGCSDRR